MSDLPERLLALAESLVGDEWNHPLKAVDDCRNAAAELKRLTRRVRELELIYKVIPALEITLCSCKMQRDVGEFGKPCERCTKLQEAKQELARLQRGIESCQA